MKAKEDSGSENVRGTYLDLSKIDTIHNFVSLLKVNQVKLDIVILNAGVALPK